MAFGVPPWLWKLTQLTNQESLKWALRAAPLATGSSWCCSFEVSSEICPSLHPSTSDVYYVYTHMHVYIYTTYVSTCMYMCIYMYLYAHLYVYIYNIHTCIYMRIYIYKPVCAYVYIYMYTYIYAGMYVNICICIWGPIVSCGHMCPHEVENCVPQFASVPSMVGISSYAPASAFSNRQEVKRGTSETGVFSMYLTYWNQ